jgi:D-alanyl-D-alanine carboxypeptidase (penicillin-binding protein 5/6)
MIRRLTRCCGPVLLGLILLFAWMPAPAWAAMPAFEGGEGVYLMDTESGDAFAAQNEDSRYNPASTTKLMTALVAMDYISDKLDQPVTVGTEIEAIGEDSSTAGLVEGDTYTWRQLLYAMLLPSGNDAAMTVAVNAARIQTGNAALDSATAVTDFVGLMNAKAGTLGLTNSHFANPHGLVAADHYTTPKDLAHFAKAALDVPEIAAITDTQSYTGTSGSGVTLEWKNSNVLIHPAIADMEASQVTAMQLTGESNPFYNAFAQGGKTGYDESAGRCLVFSGENNGMHLVGAILKASDQTTIYSQASSALNSAMTEYTHVVWSDGTTPYVKTMVTWGSFLSGFTLSAQTDGLAESTVLTADQDKLSAKVTWDSTYLEEKGGHLKILKAFEAGQQVGSIEIYNGSTQVKAIPLLAANAMAPMGLADYLIAAAVVILIALLVILLVRRSRKRREADLLYQQKRREAQRSAQALGISRDEATPEGEEERLAYARHPDQTDGFDLPPAFTDLDQPAPAEKAPAIPRARLGGKTHFRMKRIPAKRNHG